MKLERTGSRRAIHIIVSVAARRHDLIIMEMNPALQSRLADGAVLNGQFSYAINAIIGIKRKDYQTNIMDRTRALSIVSHDVTRDLIVRPGLPRSITFFQLKHC